MITYILVLSSSRICLFVIKIGRVFFFFFFFFQFPRIFKLSKVHSLYH
jgi:hypothetical protein